MKNKNFVLLFLSGLILSALFFLPSILDRTLVPRFMGLAACLAIALFFLIKEKYSFKFSFDIISGSFVVFTVFCCLSFFWANTKSEAFFESSKQVLTLFTFLFASLIFKYEKEFFMEKFLKFSIVLFLISIVFAGFQIFELSSLSKESIYQITGINGHKNLYSSFMFLNFFFLLMGYYKLAQPWKNAALFSMLLTALLLFFLRTKAVWIGSVIALLIYLFFYFIPQGIRKFNTKLKYSYLILLVILLLNLFFFFYLQDFAQKGISSGQENLAASLLKNETFKLEQERLILWDKTYKLIEKDAVKGLGMGNWQIHFPDATLSGLWRAEELNYTFQRPHNDFLWVLAETGFIGFNLFLLLLVSTFFLLIKSLKFIPDDQATRVELLSCLACIGGFYTISFFDFPKERMEHNVWIALIIALAYSNIKNYGALKTLKTFHLHTFVQYSALIILFFVFITGLKRFSGEFYTKRMFDAKNSNDNLKLIEQGNSAQNYAFSIDPTSVPLSWYLGNAYAAQGNYVQAKKEFTRAYILSPYNRNVLNDLGSACVFNNEVLDAKKYFEEAARISPRFDEPKLNLAAIYINAKDYKTASLWLNSLMHDSERRSNYEKMVELLGKQ